MLEQAAQAQLTHGGALGGLLVGKVADRVPQEVAVLGQRVQQIGALAGRGLRGAAHEVHLPSVGRQ
jgi:hypothetical protein